MKNHVFNVLVGVAFTLFFLGLINLGLSIASFNEVFAKAFAGFTAAEKLVAVTNEETLKEFKEANNRLLEETFIGSLSGTDFSVIHKIGESVGIDVQLEALDAYKAELYDVLSDKSGLMRAAALLFASLVIVSISLVMRRMGKANEKIR